MADHLILIRSGPTEYEIQGRIRGTLDIPLAPAGTAVAEQAAALIAAPAVSADMLAAAGAGTPAVPRPVALVSAPDVASVETARIVGRILGLRSRANDALANLDQGLWQGMLVDDLRTKQPRLYRQWQDNPWSIAPPEGESLDEASARVEQVLEGIGRRHRGGSVVVVVPPPLDRLVRWIVAGEALGDLWCTECPENPVAVLPMAAQWNRGRNPALRQVAAAR